MKGNRAKLKENEPFVDDRIVLNDGNIIGNSAIVYYKTVLAARKPLRSTISATINADTKTFYEASAALTRVRRQIIIKELRITTHINLHQTYVQPV